MDVCVCLGECMCLCCASSGLFVWWNSLLAWPVLSHFLLLQSSNIDIGTRLRARTRTHAWVYDDRQLRDAFLLECWLLVFCSTHFLFFVKNQKKISPFAICLAVTSWKEGQKCEKCFVCACAERLTLPSVFLRLYAVGGRDGSSCLRSVECFDPHTNRSGRLRLAGMNCLLFL